VLWQQVRFQVQAHVSVFRASTIASSYAAWCLPGCMLGLTVAPSAVLQYVRTGTVRKVLVVAGDALSRFVDWKDRCGCRHRGCPGEEHMMRCVISFQKHEPANYACSQWWLICVPHSFGWMPYLQHCAATCILFGDGCGAVVVSAGDDAEGPCSVLGTAMHR
jgi:3-oxoacyl-[acyl-carrier-protein] synthase III